MEAVLSRSTFFTRWVFPVFWVACALAFAVVLMPDRMWTRDPLFLVGPAGMLALLVWGYRTMTLTLVDEVRSGDGALLVRKGSMEARIPYVDILHVNANSMAYPDRV